MSLGLIAYEIEHGEQPTLDPPPETLMAPVVRVPSWVLPARAHGDHTPPTRHLAIWDELYFEGWIDTDRARELVGRGAHMMLRAMAARSDGAVVRVGHRYELVRR